jgi:nucleotide-binding universal stress UspA family protein
LFHHPFNAMKSFLLPLDFTDTDRHLLAWARLLTRRFGAKLTLFHVHQPNNIDTTLPNVGSPGLDMLGGTDMSSLGAGVEVGRQLDQLARQQLKDQVDALAAEGLNVQGELALGTDVEGEILNAAKFFQADLLIIGHRENPTLFDRLAGSAAPDVAAHAACPVLVVPLVEAGKGYTAAPKIDKVVYVMQPKTTQDDVSKQAGPLTDAFRAELKVLLPDAIDGLSGDVLVMQRYEHGALDGLFGQAKADAFMSSSPVPVLVYH